MHILKSNSRKNIKIYFRMKKFHLIPFLANLKLLNYQEEIATRWKKFRSFKSKTSKPE